MVMMYLNASVSAMMVETNKVKVSIGMYLEIRLTCVVASLPVGISAFCLSFYPLAHNFLPDPLLSTSAIRAGDDWKHRYDYHLLH